MRTQWCREHIDKTAEECGLGQDTVSEVKKSAAFCDENPNFVDCSTKAIMALIRVKDAEVRERAISLAQNALNVTLPTGGKKQKSLTEREIKKLIDQADRELRKELMKDPPPEKKPPAKPDPKSIRCMYLPRDGTAPCNAPEEYQQKCTEEVRKNRNCPLPIVVLQSRRLSDDLEGEEKPSESAVNTRKAIIPQSNPEDLKKYEVTARRYAQSAIRQIVHHKIADTEEQSAQRAFDLGLEYLLEKVEEIIQTEGEAVMEE